MEEKVRVWEEEMEAECMRLLNNIILQPSVF